MNYKIHTSGVLINILLIFFGIGIFIPGIYIYCSQQFVSNNQETAQTNNLSAIGLMGIGIILVIIGGVRSWRDIKSSKNIKWLLKNGTKISTQFKNIHIYYPNRPWKHETLYTISTQWQNPENQQKYIFESEYIWYNPKKYIENKNINVLTDPSNHNNYYMDIDFLTVKV